MFEMVKSDLAYLDRAPHRLVTEMLVFAPPERVFDVLAGESFHEWLDSLSDWRWTSKPPHGVGSTREVVLALLPAAPKVVVQERFLAWERGKRLAFSIDSMSMPLVKQMVEEMRLERRGERRTQLTYMVHYTPGPLMRVVHPLARVIFGKMFRDAARKVAMVAARGEIAPVAGARPSRP